MSVCIIDRNEDPAFAYEMRQLRYEQLRADVGEEDMECSDMDDVDDWDDVDDGLEPDWDDPFYQQEEHPWP